MDLGFRKPGTIWPGIVNENLNDPVILVAGVDAQFISKKQLELFLGRGFIQVSVVFKFPVHAL
jgi:hypothetical protein